MKKKRLIALIIILIFAVFVILFWYTTVSNRKKETKSSKNTSSQKLKFAVNKPDNQNTEPVLTASQQIENRQRQAIINFYSNYPKNADDVATTSHLTKLGSPTLLASYKAKKTA